MPAAVSALPGSLRVRSAGASVCRGFRAPAAFEYAAALGLRVACIMALLMLPRPARAGTEEFSTFDVWQQEEDDESVIDHLLTHAPREWLPAWQRATNAFRTQEGCLTSGQWFIHTDLKAQTELGDRAKFAVLMRQNDDDISRFDYVDLQFRYPIVRGTVVGMFRPFFDKSRQDFAVSWELGADTTAFQVTATFGLEDLFNNLWAFRQTRVGNHVEAYLRHPWEPALRVASRHDHWSADVQARYLTPSEKSVPGTVDPDSVTLTTLWGTQVTADVLVRALGCEWELTGSNQQAYSTAALVGAGVGPGGNYRRGWSGEATVRRDLARNLGAELSYVYSNRAQHHTAPLGPGAFGALDRVAQAELSWRAHPRLTVRAGGMFDRVDVAQSGLVFQHSYGTRNESRGYLGLAARFGRVTISGVEGIELDPEPYPVWFHHDKGFLTLQAIF